MGNEIGSGGQYPGQQRSHSGPPPVSEKQIAKYLTPIRVTADDLLEETNKECVVCLGDQLIGDPASKLPCGHLFHVGCVEQWLKLHCTCPVCRFELETDDSLYEKERKDRMKSRKLRYRRDELNKKSVSALKEIMAGFKINAVNCFDKRDLVDRLIGSGHIEVIEGCPAIEMTESALADMSVRQLHELMLSLGVSSAGAIEKADLIRRLVESGRVVTVVEMESHAKDITFEATARFQPDCSEHVVLNAQEIEQVLNQLSIRDLTQLLHSNNISTVGMLEREELVRSFMASGLAIPSAGSVSDIKIAEEQFEMDVTDADHTESVSYSTAYTSVNNSHTVSASSTVYSGSPDCQATMLSVRELKEICAALGVNVSGCIDKTDIISVIKQSGHSLT